MEVNDPERARQLVEEYQKKHEINMDEDVHEDEFDEICGKKDH
jgi:hypothetical protein